MSSSPTSAITIAQANQELIERTYQAFARGDIPTVLEALAVDIHWHVPGRGVLPQGPFSAVWRSCNICTNVSVMFCKCWARSRWGLLADWS